MESISTETAPEEGCELEQSQVQRLIKVMTFPFTIHGVGNFPTLNIKLADLVNEVVKRVNADSSVPVVDVKINGGLASHILAACDLPFGDVDLIFVLDESKPASMVNLDIMKQAVLDSLLEFLPPGASKARLSPCDMKRAYVKKLVLVNEPDNHWSLVCLNNESGRFIELKFVYKMKRQFQFSVDSFQIQLSSLMKYFNKGRELMPTGHGQNNLVVVPSTRQKSGSMVSTDRSTDSGRGESDFSDPEDSSHNSSRRDSKQDPLSPKHLTKLHEVINAAAAATQKPAATTGTSPSSTTDMLEISTTLSDCCSDISSAVCSPVAVARVSLIDDHKPVHSAVEVGTDHTSPVSSMALPTVTATSLYGDFEKAMWHLNNHLIDTKQPEEIIGGGLLKYCNLLIRGYRPARPKEVRRLERYMCSRFFIDFFDVEVQYSKLSAYLDNHFIGDPALKYEYLLVLHRVIGESTVCLMTHERKQSLEMIENMAAELSWFIHTETSTLENTATESLQGGSYDFYCGSYGVQCDIPYCKHSIPHFPRQTLVYLTDSGAYWMPLSV